MQAVGGTTPSSVALDRHHVALAPSSVALDRHHAALASSSAALDAITRRLHHLARRVTTITRHLHHHKLQQFVIRALFNFPKRTEATEGLGIFEDLPQFDPLPAVGSDDRVTSFKDLP